MRLPPSADADGADHAWVLTDSRTASERFDELFGGARACAAGAPATFARWLLSPVSLSEFEKSVYGRRPLAVRRADGGYFDGLFSTEAIDGALRAGALRFTSDLDLAVYTEADGRKTLNPPGGAGADAEAGADAPHPLATPALVWPAHASGASVRLSWPQRVHEPLWRACHLLDEHFGGAAGANAYLTPDGARGFAPHWDDVDVFILQLEGSKLWTVHPPLEPHPRESSGNLPPADLPDACLRLTLRPGDVLYLPRGWIHHAQTTPTVAPAGKKGKAAAAAAAAAVDGGAAGAAPAAGRQGSLHVTLSTGRKETWLDLTEGLLAQALGALAAAKPAWRQNLPLRWERVAGVQHAPPPDDGGGGDGDGESEGEEGSGDEAEDGAPRGARRRRLLFVGKVRALLDDLRAHADELIDDAADELATRHVWDRLPPPPPPGGRVGAWRAPEAAEWAAASAQGLLEAGAVSLDSRLRLRARGCARLTADGEVAVLHHSLANSTHFHALEAPEQICFALSAAPALEAVLCAYPRSLCVRDLPVGPDDGESDAGGGSEDGSEAAELSAAADDQVRLDVARALVEAGVVLHQRGNGAVKPLPRARPPTADAARAPAAQPQKSGKRKRGGMSRAEKRAAAGAAQ
jgi:lysine-specific demethylase/histidyl-hydroxylase NO66